MKNYIQPGDTLTITNSSGAVVLSGRGILIGATVAIAAGDIANGATGSAMVRGVFSHAKGTAAGSGGAQGANVYWDNAAKNFTAVATGNTLAGYFARAAADADTSCEVKLTG